MKTPPLLVLYIKYCAMSNIPIGHDIYEKALSDHPEYFREEIEHRNKWRSIPQDVKDAYFDELHQEWNKIHDASENKGIVYWINHPEEYKIFNDKLKKECEQFKPIEIELHNKHFSKYGL